MNESNKYQWKTFGGSVLERIGSPLGNSIFMKDKIKCELCGLSYDKDVFDKCPFCVHGCVV